MSVSAKTLGIDRLDVDERLALVEEIWATICVDAKGFPLTDAQRAAKPPVSHSVVMRHPITRESVLYLNPGYSIRINEMSDNDSEQALAYLFAHQLQDKYRYRHRWSVGDVLMWDNFGTIHNAVADYTPQEHRLIKRCQVMADKVLPAARLA